MVHDKKQCPDCRAETIEGFILDRTVGEQLVPRWMEGPPDKSFWTGVKTKGRECRSVETYRCVKCGLLRSYAMTEVDPPNFWGR